MFRSLAIVLVLLSGAACNVMSAGVQGSGVAASEDRQTSVFERVEVDGSFAVEITVGPVQSVRVEADANLLPIITTEVADATLKVASKQNYSTTSPLRVTVTAPKLTGVRLAGSGSVRVAGISGDAFTAGLSGSGKIQLAGSAASLTADMNGSGSLAASELTTRAVTVSMVGSGLAEVHASDQVTAAVTGSGAVKYAGGAAAVTRNVQGSGSVAPM